MEQKKFQKQEIQKQTQKYIFVNGILWFQQKSRKTQGGYLTIFSNISRISKMDKSTFIEGFICPDFEEFCPDFSGLFRTFGGFVRTFPDFSGLSLFAYFAYFAFYLGTFRNFFSFPIL